MRFNGYSKLKVLIIDDFDSFRLTLNKIVSDLGVTNVQTCSNGNDAIEMCSETEFDLILSDYNLGIGRNGQQLLEELKFRSILGNSIFIMVSAETDRNIIMSACDYEPDAYLTKPITAKALSQRLDRLLSHKQELKVINQALNEHKYPKAIALLEHKIKEQPGRAMLYQKLLADAYFECEHFDRAEEVYRSVLEMRKLDWAQVGLAKIKVAQGEYEKAVQWLREIIDESPQCLKAYDVLAEAYEKLGNQDELQSTLNDAVDLSPLSILRQLKLGQVAMDNNDFSIASKAFNKTIKTGRYSCHNSRENHVNFVRSASQMLAMDPTDSDDVYSDAMKVLDNLDKLFQPISTEDKAQEKLLGSQMNAYTNRPRKAQELLEEGHRLLEKAPNVNVDTDLDYVYALMALGKEADAQNRLKELVEKYANDEEALMKIDRLLSEPVSGANKKRIANYNNKGIELYKEGQFQEATNCFKKALNHFPKHVGIQLNLIQCYIGLMKDSGVDKQLYASCLATVKKLGTLLSETHEQFPRYSKLKSMLESLKGK